MASSSSTSKTGNKSANPAASLIAGAFAGSIEGFVTYPTEFVKTRSQFRSATAIGKPPGPIEILKTTIARDGVKGLYSGCSALVIGNGLKAGVRFFSYEKFKKALVDQDGKLTGPRSLLAGLGAGMFEALIAVTPSETIKTKLVNESMKPNPRFTGLVQGTKEIIKIEGIGGIYRGLFPVMMRQGANSAVRFSTYSSLKAVFQGNVSPGQQLPSFMTFAIGGVAGVVTVYCTMPLDVIKTRMQSLEAKTKYSNSFDCAYQIFKFEGISRFWKGTTPRLIRLSLSGGIVFTVYENVIKLMGGLSI
ncbi:hypothetical protein PGT21_005031 [Puccinia graminis f. sp. tritici]|uniref:Mitochondrial tricarboxylate transporter n=2 Tax=Puccinia graminis f. sp. tritici TaxID=56615 RepID=E3KY26_PUCGT|nr:uncharacterized protein PGTG_15068 [Puccinia graminis f. sp. tritici CRL 75-36-700-3]KAA1083577.1 hypothetical protein PGTUg99_036346 [Puccinia graminis f. sp. tritici]EFP89227.1 hypothetical protein PGTG_15068 [Puccinia graminis f. sp. tritici CRL 75-36-700-3]KAA1093941.1 hypothetical protein PGT21_003870 [Puccinia graminis f. sp. tritici]KAA1108234.1 hypothetical protein PGT21_005031 [Puccinia graminis f. sp. tritici]KAA1130080.1 hypothetical protein PGTUg99_008292 [Puccinia graminis f. s